MTGKKNLPLLVQVLYGVGVSYAIVDQIFAQWVLYYYLPPENSGLTPLLSPLFIALALVISRFVDMVADPLVGYWSDKVDTRWGRRIPFIAAGAVPLALCTVAYFYPFKGSEMATFSHLAVVGCLFFIFYTIVGAPYNAMIPEISHSQRDRINLSTWQSVFRLVYTAVAMVLPGLMIKMLGGGDTEKGVRGMVIVLSILATIGMLVTAFTVDERKYSGGKTSEHGLFSSLKSVFSNKSFVIYLFGFLFFFIGFNGLRASMNYYVEDIMGAGKVGITIASGILFGTSALFFAPVNILSRKFGYKGLMVISLIMLVGVSCCLYGLGKVFPLWTGYLFFALAGIPIAGAAFIFPPAMLSEISAVASKKTGVQIEGIFFGIQGFFLKMAFLVSIAVLPVLLVSGSDISFVDSLTKKPEGVQKAGIYMTTIFSAVAFLMSAIFYWFFPEEIVRED